MERSDLILQSYSSSRLMHTSIKEEDAAPSSRGSIKSSSHSATASARARQEQRIMQKAVSTRNFAARSFLTQQSTLHVLLNEDLQEDENHTRRFIMKD